ncbi:MAG: hydroxyethylthiazole kinase, partial [Streptosporangiales bacterium]|nr:hydroxyethylthiazole kinase [Streptosporangiales bacterium]
MTAPPTMPIDDVVADLAALRRRTPLVHCLTNDVVKNVTANVLLAAGAAPAMIEDPGEAAEFARVADALLVNLGTLTEPQAEAINAAVPAAHDAGTPWVLDPVAVGAVTFRTQVAHELLAAAPTVVRGNASEILALARAGGGGRGVESIADSSDAVGVAVELARTTGGVVAVSGTVDYVTDGDVTYAVPGGHPLLTRMTGAGCALGALVAAATAASGSPLRGAVTASTLVAAAAELAARECGGPGSFAVALLDA